MTLSTKDREHLFGEITNWVVQLTRAGGIAIACWKEIPLHFTNIELDEFIVMPNHIHGILSIIETLRRDVQLNIPTDDYFSRISPKRGSLAVVVRTCKADDRVYSRRGDSRIAPTRSRRSRSAIRSVGK